MGTVDSPYLSISTVHHHLQQTAEKHPELTSVCELIKDHLYVDDLLLAVASENKAIQFRKETSKIFEEMKMKIQKWCSNSSKVLKTIPQEERSPFENISDNNNDGGEITFQDPDIITSQTKLLGMTWSPKLDTFHYNTYEKLLENKKIKYSKRGISSIIPSIYDPIGILQPYTIRGKLNLQKTWTHRDANGRGLNWDDVLPGEIQKEWEKWLQDIPKVSQMQIKRYIFSSNNPPKRLFLHCFGDGGSNAWGIVIYIRWFNETTGKYTAQIVYSASRVGPTKRPLSVPRKELNSVVLACEKAKYIAKAMNINHENIFIHTDSLIVLHWVTNFSKNNLKTYVGNRIEKIQQHHYAIYHTPGAQNPSDLCTKTHNTQDYVNNTFWINGPDYLQDPTEQWKEKYKLENIIKQELE